MQSLVSGADCGPVNPLSQLSKLYQQDRSNQQDHFAPQPGPSTSTGFRRAPGAPGPSGAHDEAAQFFQQPQPHHLQTFDMSSLNRALTPQQQQQLQQAAVPDWAKSFTETQGGAGPGEMFGPPHPSLIDAQARAFATPSPQQHWGNDFLQHQRQQQGTPEARQQSPLTSAPGPAAGVYQSRGVGQAGFMFPPSSLSMSVGGSAMQQMYPGGGFDHAHQLLPPSTANAQLSHTSTDWDKAFLAQESSVKTSAEQQDATAAEQEASIRPASPVLTDNHARDALAQTAGALLDTVQSVERQRTAEASGSTATSDKFANSTFLDLMRRLRDGEVAVEGDKVVEQVGPAAGGVDVKGKGKARAEGWATDFAASGSREEEGRVGAADSSSTNAFGMRVDPTTRDPSVLAQFTNQQHSFAERQAMNAQFARDRERDYAEMNQMWEDEDQARSAREDKGKGKEKSPFQFQGDGGGISEEMDLDERTEAMMRMDTSVPLASSNWEEDFDADMIAGGHARNIPRTTAREPSAQQKEWDTLQQDWDNFEATATGIKQTSTAKGPDAYTLSTPEGYQFAEKNPYLNMTRMHSLHANTAGGATRTTYDSVLEHEAAVQRDPHNAVHWLALGIKQQENEREELAIKALRRALEIDPSMGEAYLALAVSFTNENERASAYESVDKWVDSLAPRYAKEVDTYRDLFGRLPPANAGMSGRHEYLTGLLIRLAQAGTEGAAVDADVQIALGVLFNTSEEYEKASDCFEAALSVRPDDPLLYNRLGATLANSGKTDAAIQYYVEALELQPAYVRARFNLAVANMNLGQYEQAVEHLMTSLSIQEADHELQDGEENNNTSGVTSHTLWDSLNIALLMMHRSDLATYTIQRDLAGLRNHFATA
ncbi:hypothetical protein T439DRAFT_326252 [Meredithblackwellia eburnea MCA 4105]